MGVTDEYLRMLVEVKGDKALTDLQAQLVNVGKEEQNLAALFKQGAISEELLTAETKRLAAAKAQLTAAVSGLSGGFGKYSQNLTAASYALNDFASNNGSLAQKLNGVANNLPGVFAGFGGLGLALGALVPVVAALYQNWDSIAGLWGDTAGNALPKNTNALKAVDDELKRVNDRLDDYKKKQHLTNDELAKYNELSAEQLRLEKEKAAEQERQNALKALLTSADDAQKDRAGSFAAASAGQGPQVLAAIKQAMDGESGQRIDREKARADADIQKHFLTNPSLDDQAAFAKKRMGEFDAFKRTEGGDSTRLAEDLFLKLGKGEAGADARLGQLMDAGTGAQFGGLGGRVFANSKAGKAQAAADKVLNETGQSNEQAMREGDEKKRDKDAAETKKERDKILFKGFESAAELQANVAKYSKISINDDRTPAEKAKAQKDFLADSNVRSVSREITQRTGGDVRGNQADTAARRAIELNEQGVQGMDALNQGVAETLAMTNGLAQEWQRQRAFSEQLLQEAKFQRRKMQGAANAPTNQNMGTQN